MYALLIYQQVAALFVPVAQHPSIYPVTIYFQGMQCGSMRVSMDQQLRIVIFAQQCCNCFRVHVHDAFLLAGFFLFTALTQCRDLCFTHIERLLEKFLLPGGVANLAAESLVGSIIGTERIAMAQQCALPMQDEEGRVGQQLEPGCVSKCLADQEIPVAMHEVELCAVIGQRSQCLDDRLVMGKVVVARPVFEKITQNVQRPGLGSLPVQEVQELGSDGGSGVAEVQVGNQQAKCRFVLVRRLHPGDVT